MGCGSSTQSGPSGGLAPSLTEWAFREDAPTDRAPRGFVALPDTCKSMVKKFVTPEMYDELKDKKTACGFTFDNVINSAVENLDSSIGVYAGDEESYTMFAALFDKIIEAYHVFPSDGVHVRDLDPSHLNAPNPDPEGEFVVSTRIRVGRNLKAYPLIPGLSRAQRKEVEERVVKSLKELEGDLSGEYYPLEGMDEATRQKLVDDHFLFKRGDRFLEAGSANRDWPEGRGIFHSADKRFLVWVNEEDELRIISMQEGADIAEVFERLCRAIASMETKIEFAFNDHLGFLTSCPTNLGTAMRASVHIRIPLVSAHADFKQWCEDRHLQPRGIHGEHSESSDGTFDISNKRRLGLTEVQCVQTLFEGVRDLIAWEKQLRAENAAAAAQ